MDRKKLNLFSYFMQLRLLTTLLFLISLSVSAQSVVPAPEMDTIPGRTTIEVAPVESSDQGEPNYQFLPVDEADSIRLQLRKVPDSTISRLQEDDDFWYANTAREKKKKERDSGGLRYKRDTSFSWISMTLWIIIVGLFLALVIYYMAESGLFRRKRRIQAEKTQESEEMPEDIFAINYQQEIDKAEANADYRLAVRLHYLYLLRRMADGNMIRYQQDRTNMDYLMQLHGTAWYKDFFRATLHYEYSWYGNFAVTATEYQVILQDIKKIGNRS